MVTSLHMGWRHVLFANWPVDPELLDAHLPSTLSVDTHDSVVGARLFHHLPCYYARCSLTEADGHVQFRSQRLHPDALPVHFEGTYGPTGPGLSVRSDSLDEFLTERYRYYTETPDGSLRYAAIDHEPWPLYEAEPTIPSPNRRV